MALIYSEKPCKVAGTFTTNVVKAAPVKWDQADRGRIQQKSQAVIINSGIANACTGVEGMDVLSGDSKRGGKGTLAYRRSGRAGRIYRSDRNAASDRQDQSRYLSSLQK